MEFNENKQNRNRLIDAENRLTAIRVEGGWGLGEKGKGNKQNKNRQSKEHGDCERESRVGEVGEGKGQINGSGSRLDFGW